VGVDCNSVKHARGAHFGRLSKTVPKVAGSHANRGINRHRRLLTNMGLTMECPSQAGKLVSSIGCRGIRQRRNWQPARRCEFGSAQRLVQVMGSTWHDLKLGRMTVQGIRVIQQLTKQELADGAARWACKTWVSGSHGLPRSWDHGAECG